MSSFKSTIPRAKLDRNGNQQSWSSEMSQWTGDTDYLFNGNTAFPSQFESFTSPVPASNRPAEVHQEQQALLSAVTISSTSSSSTPAPSPPPPSPRPPSKSTVPAWVNTLSTASIKADMAAADVNGTVSYSGLEKLLVDLDSTLSASKTSLTSAELSDLQTIVKDLNNGMTTSAYLTSVMGSLVSGNASNATWTGGATTSTSLGNLAGGSSAAQLAELTGKWFLGTDLPSSQVSMDGENFSVSYSACSSPLFGASGPSINDVNQGNLGDCFLLAGLAEVANQDSAIISSMFTSNGNGTFGVKFYVDGAAQYITVNNSLADGGSIFNHASNMWASLAEKAYTQLQAAGNITGGGPSDGNSWSSIGNGGAAEYALEEITGASKISDFVANSGSWLDVAYNSSLSMTGYTLGNSTTATLDTLISDLSQGDDLILSSYTNATDSSGRATLVADHAMSVYGYDDTTGMLEIRNPWGTAAGQSWNTTFEVGLSTLLSDGDIISADNVGTKKAAPVVVSQTANQTWGLGQAVSFALPSGTFYDPEAEKLTYSATQSGGSALPSWLTFNAATQAFTGTAPTTPSTLGISITATDTSGLSASETFSASISAAANQLAQSSSALTSSSGPASTSLAQSSSTSSPTLSSPLA